MKYRLFHGTEPLTGWTKKSAKDVDAWRDKIAADNDLNPKTITIGIDDTGEKEAATKAAKKGAAKK